MGQYTEYLETSQATRMALESHEGLSELVRRTLSSRNTLSGDHHTTFRLGNVQDIYVAIRAPLRLSSLSYTQADLEYCARKYAESIKGRYRIPKFAIGAIIGTVPYLFTEDLTDGGRYRIAPTNDGGGKLEPMGQEILFDFGLEDFSIGQQPQIKEQMLRQPLFFAPENLLRVK